MDRLKAPTVPYDDVPVLNDMVGHEFTIPAFFYLGATMTSRYTNDFGAAQAAPLLSFYALINGTAGMILNPLTGLLIEAKGFRLATCITVFFLSAVAVAVWIPKVEAQFLLLYTYCASVIVMRGAKAEASVRRQDTAKKEVEGRPTLV